ncbi:MAG: hypothetical protein J6S79_03030 [Lachnospiraceae bacterium]|nr:hypothetical protein [Lachnospiraceae bacterium]
MQNLEGKKTTLDDDAEIYKVGTERSDGKSARQHWKELSRKGKWDYFVTYYLWKIALVLVVCALIGYMVYAAVRPKKDPLVYLAVIDSVLEADRLNIYFEDLSREIDGGKHPISVDTRLTSSVLTTQDMGAISTYIYAGDLDIMVAVEAALTSYAKSGMLCDLSETLPADILAAIPEEDRFYYHYVPDKNAPAGDSERDIFIGIHVAEQEFIKSTNLTGYPIDYLLTLVATGKHVKDGNTFKVLRAIYGLPQTE